MGAYLSTPLTDKASTDEANECLSCGASEMQGWRMSQEDAHICSLDFDKSISLFAVFDGHGGPEVALYCSKKLPEFLKTTEAYKAKEYEKALEDAFIGFDTTLVNDEIIEELKKFMPADKMDGETDSDDDRDDDDFEDLSELHQESRMPIEELLEKLKDGKNIPLARLKQGEGSGVKPISPCLRGASSQRKIDMNADDKEEEAVSSSSASAAIENCQTSSEAGSSSPAGSSSATSNIFPQIAGSRACDGPSSSTGGGSSKSFFADKNACDSPDSSSTIQKSSDNAKDTSLIAEPSSAVSKPDGPCSANGNGNECGSSSGNSKHEGVSSSSIAENGIPKTRNKISSTLLLPSMIDSDDSSSTSDGSYNDEGNEEKSDTEEDEESDEDEEENDDNDEEEDEEDDAEEGNAQDFEDDENFLNNMFEGPGSSSGCTAVVALLVGNELYVANAGDSRCVVCRNGVAMEMSLDHKPEDSKELERIQKAGGRVTMDGRVNGGLNLSRAIGDHAYKTNKDLKPEAQMISALPDVKRATITSDDEFMILACDGIWNSLSSEEVVEFVRSRILNGETKMSAICEELFTACLAPNTIGDGTGCDNMTAVIVQFKPLLVSDIQQSNENKNTVDVTTTSTTSNKKRSASPTTLNEETESRKRIKTDDQKDMDSVVSAAETTST